MIICDNTIYNSSPNSSVNRNGWLWQALWHAWGMAGGQEEGPVRRSQRSMSGHHQFPL